MFFDEREGTFDYCRALRGKGGKIFLHRFVMNEEKAPSSQECYQSLGSN